MLLFISQLFDLFQVDCRFLFSAFFSRVISTFLFVSSSSSVKFVSNFHLLLDYAFSYLGYAASLIKQAEVCVLTGENVVIGGGIFAIFLVFFSQYFLFFSFVFMTLS